MFALDSPALLSLGDDYKESHWPRTMEPRQPLHPVAHLIRVLKCWIMSFQRHNLIGLLLYHFKSHKALEILMHSVVSFELSIFWHSVRTGHWGSSMSRVSKTSHFSTASSSSSRGTQRRFQACWGAVSSARRRCEPGPFPEEHNQNASSGKHPYGQTQHGIFIGN